MSELQILLDQANSKLVNGSTSQNTESRKIEELEQLTDRNLQDNQLLKERNQENKLKIEELEAELESEKKSYVDLDKKYQNILNSRQHGP